MVYCLSVCLSTATEAGPVGSQLSNAAGRRAECSKYVLGWENDGDGGALVMMMLQNNRATSPIIRRLATTWR